MVDQRSGTIVLGADVKISRVAVSQGGLTLRVEENPIVIQPNPFTIGGQPLWCPIPPQPLSKTPAPQMALVETAVSLPEVIEGLNALGVLLPAI